MTRIINTTSKRPLSAKLAAGFAVAAMLVLGTSAAPANARAYHHYYNGGYYRAPPVVYGSRTARVRLVILRLILLRWLAVLLSPAGHLWTRYRHKLAVHWHQYSVSVTSRQPDTATTRRHCPAV